jgi:hypothetical protein
MGQSDGSSIATMLLTVTLQSACGCGTGMSPSDALG